MQFQDELAAGVTLIRPALQSPNYVAGVSGWAIKVDGSAEFNNLVIRGSGPGDAIIIGPTGMPQVRIGSTASAGYINFPTNRPIELDDATILAGVLNSGAANEAATLQIFGPTVSGATDQARIFLNSQNNDGSSQANMSLRAGSGVLTFDEIEMILSGSRLRVVPSATANPALSVEAATGHTGALIRASLNGVNKALINEEGLSLIPTASALAAINVATPLAHTGAQLALLNDGVTGFSVDTSGTITTYGENTFKSFTPTVTGGGTATFTTQTGLWERVGKLIWISIYLVVNAAGSGAAAVNVATPVAVARSQRQLIPAHGGGLGGPGAGEYSALCFTGGAGAVIDRLSRGGVDLTGANLSAGATITIEGWYREA